MNETVRNYLRGILKKRKIPILHRSTVLSTALGTLGMEVNAVSYCLNRYLKVPTLRLGMLESRNFDTLRSMLRYLAEHFFQAPHAPRKYVIRQMP